MPRSEQQHLGSEIAQIKRAIKDLQSGRLQNASMHGSRLYIYDDDGDIREVIGNQGDGSYGSRVIKSPPQPTPTAPILTAGELGSVMAEWDGGIVQGSVPVVHGHLKVLAMFLGEDGQWDPDEARLVSSIRDRDGGATTLALGTPGRWAVAFQMVGADRVTLGAVSAPSEITVTALVDTEAIEAELEAANDRITEADERLTSGQDVLDGKLEILDTERLPAIESTLSEKAASSELDAISNGVAALTGTNAKTFIQDTEPPAPTGAVAYEWAGTPHASESVKRVAGVEVARNLLTNPSFETGTSGWSHAAGITIIGRTTFGPAIYAGTTAASVATESAAASNAHFFVSSPMPISPGKYPAASVALRRSSGATHARLWFEYRSGGAWHSNGGASPIFELSTEDNADSLRHAASGDQAPDGADGVRLWVRLYGGPSASDAPTDGITHADAFMAAVEDSSDKALAQVERYFDGDTPDEPAESGLWINTAEDDARYWWDHDQQAWIEVTDSAAFGRVVADRIFANLGVFDRIDAREGWVGGVALKDSAVTSRSVDTEEFFAAQAVIEKIWADIVRAKMIETQGFITEDMIATESITTPKLHVTEEMVARFAQILHLVADQVEMNTFVAQSGMVGVLEAIGIVLSNEAGRRRFEVSGDGFRLTDTGDNHVIAQLGTQSDDLISLHDSETGEPSITLSQDGGVGSQALTVASDPSFGGKRLAGDVYESPRWHSSSSVFGMTGGHVVAHHRRAFNGESSGNTTNGQSIAHLEARIDPGRLYRVQCHDFEMNDRRPYFIEAFYTTSNDPDVRPGPPNRLSLTWGASPARVPQSGEGHGSKLTFDRVVGFNTARRIRINFVVGVNGGTGTLNFGGLQRHAAHFTVTDLGPNLGSSGADLWQGAGASTGSVPEPQSLLREIYPVARTATYTLSSSGVATRQYTNGEMRFGRWPDGNTYLTVMEFAPWNQPGAPQAAELPFRVSRWVGTSGNIVQVGLPGFSGTPASFTYGTQVEALPAVRNVGTTSQTQIPLDRDQQMAIAARQSAAVVLGGTGWTSAPYPASGVATTTGVVAALATDVSGQTTG